MTTLEPFEYMEWVNVTLDGWAIKGDAPDEVVKAFNVWMEKLKPME